MKHFNSSFSVAVLVAGCLVQSACAEPPPATAPVYDFDWRIGGATEVRPYQVFDDGQKIYLQFDDPKHVPALFADTPGGLVLLRWHADPPYVVVDRVDPALVFRSAGVEAHAVRAAPEGPPRMAQFGSTRPTGKSSINSPQASGGGPIRSINPPDDK